MLEFLWAYGLFLAKVVTALIAFALLIAIIAGGRKKGEKTELKITHLNDRYQQVKQQLLQAVMPAKEFKQQQKALAKANKKSDKERIKAEDEASKRL